MQPKTYEKSLLALAAYRAALSDDKLEILAVASVFRNRVLRYGKTYSAVFENAEVNRGWPSITNPVLIDPANGILVEIEGIYDGTSPDFTANHLHQNGAMWFGNPIAHEGTGDEFELNILRKQDEHPLIGKFGATWFWE